MIEIWLAVKAIIQNVPEANDPHIFFYDKDGDPIYSAPYNGKPEFGPQDRTYFEFDVDLSKLTDIEYTYRKPWYKFW
ncbi:MAG: hypothetical protein ABH827_02745 [bacterium]